MSKTKISVVTSAYNEEEGIKTCVVEVRKVLESLGDEFEYEHVIADNCSTDKTLAILREIAAEDPRVKVIANSRNFGAEKSAFNAVKYCTGDAVVGITADLQEPPSVIPEMVRLWKTGYEVVYGIYRNPHDGIGIRLVRKLYYWLVDKLSAETLPRDFMGFALMDRRVVDEVISVDDFAPYIRGIIAMVGFRQIGIPYDRAKRETGESKHGLAFLFDFGLNGLISHSVVPIRAATILGLSLFALSILAILAVLIVRFAAPSVQAPGITTVVIIITFFSGIQLLFFGTLGEYIGAIHSQTRRKPFVIVRETINVDRELPARRIAAKDEEHRKPSLPVLLPPKKTEKTPKSEPPPVDPTERRALVIGGDAAIGAALEADGYVVTRARAVDFDTVLASSKALSAVVWAANDTDRFVRALDALGNGLAAGGAICIVGTDDGAMAKASLGGLVKGASAELAPKKIRLNAVIASPSASHDDVASTVAMLFDRRASGVSGQSVCVDAKASSASAS